MPDDVIAEFQRYADLTAALTRGATVERDFVPTAETNEIVQIERGVVFAQAVDSMDEFSASSAVDRLIEVAPRMERIVVADRAGHHRPVYKPLLVYAWLQAFRIWYETLPRSEFGRWEEGSRAWCDQLESDIGSSSNLASSSASAGASTAALAWAALALHIAGKVFIRDAFTDLAADTMGRIARAQQPNGPFLRGATSSDNPETHWYHELVILHALSSYAVQAEDRTIASAVALATSFHLNEIEPNHASDAPWALFAFVWNRRTRSIADQLLHAAQARPLNEVSLMLLADALYCLKLFTP